MAISGIVICGAKKIKGAVRPGSRTVNGSVQRSALPGGMSYDGPYNVTPGDEAQELPTAGKSPAQNIIVEAIPSNYGKIGWDGARLTVS